MVNTADNHFIATE